MARALKDKGKNVALSMADDYDVLESAQKYEPELLETY